MPPSTPGETIDLTATRPGRRLKIVLVGFYNYESHALRIFQPLLEARGHEVHTIFFKNYFTYSYPTPKEENMVVELVEKIQPDLLCMSVWSTYFQLAGRLSDRIKAAVNPVVIWGGIHPQTKGEECLRHADLVCRGEGEYVLAELTDRMSLGQGWLDLRGCWVKSDAQIIKNPPRFLLNDVNLLPTADVSPHNKYYLGKDDWRDVGRWDSLALGYDVMMVRGCPYECTFCIHNFTRKATEGMGSYVRRRSVDHCLAELRAAKKAKPLLRTVAFSDDIFAPTRPWLEEFCARYKEEIDLPFIMFSFARMVDEKKIALMRDAGLFATTMGVQSGAERIRRDVYGRETSNEEIINACRIFKKYGVMANLDFIGDNPYESDDDRRQTVDLLCDLPKPFYFNYFSLTYFPGVDLTVRALRDGFIEPEDIEDVAEKGYSLWGGSLVESRSDENLTWDVAYAMAVHGFPKPMIHRLLRSTKFRRHIRKFVPAMQRLVTLSRAKLKLQDQLAGRPNLYHQFWANTNRDAAFPEIDMVQPNFDSSPLRAPMATPEQRLRDLENASAAAARRIRDEAVHAA